jgi:uncharacterized protein (DUF2235 family)
MARNDRADWAAGRPVRQLIDYDPGIGAPDSYCRADRLAQATGAGITANIKQVYRFLASHYEPDDRIFLIGFSRGAYTARSVGGLLGVVGLPRRTGRAPQADLAALTERAYAIYKMTPSPDPANAPAEREKAAADFIRETGWQGQDKAENRAPWMIGVWDTVRALGIPLGWTDVEIPGFSHRFHDHELNRHVRHAYHALAIDEERNQFLPTLWNEPTAAERHAQATGQPNPQRFEQVWFPGVHSDVGGGYAPHPHEVGKGQLSDVTLRWMLERALTAGLLLDPAKGAAPETFPVNPHAQVNDSRDTFFKKLLYWRAVRNVSRGAQAAGTTIIEQPLGPGPLQRYWVSRISALFGTTGAWNPDSLKPHPDVRTAQAQLAKGQKPPPGPFANTV